MIRRQGNIKIEDICDMIPRDTVEEYAKDFEEIYDEKFEFVEIEEQERWTDKLGNEYANVVFKYKSDTPQVKYDKNNTKQIKLKLNRKTDKDILDHLETVDNRQGYIKELIRRDMEG